MNDTITTAGATAAIISPLWLPWLDATSQIASVILPILGVIWLGVQIVAKVREFKRGA